MDMMEFDEAMWSYWHTNPDKIPYLTPAYNKRNQKIAPGMLLSKTAKGRKRVCRCVGNKRCHACYQRRLDYNRWLLNNGLGHMV